jgi:dTDP-4-amino-4,6-dideoxygalactose transaminase
MTIDAPIDAPVTAPVDSAPPEPVPFVDLGLAHRRIAPEVQRAFDEVLSTTSFVLGPAVSRFEAEFAAYCETARCVGVGNGTDAVELALRAAGIGAGDEVVVPANTFVATVEGVLRAGARPVFADVDEHFLLDPASVAERTTARTRAVVPVHLYGQPAPVERLREVLGRDVLVVEDAAQSQGARRHGVRSGALGDVAATSFYPGKNLGAYGDAGAVTTGSDAIADRVQALRNHGGVRRYEHQELGTNSRLDSLQAGVLSVKLARLDLWNDERRAAAETYAALLGDLEWLTLPEVAPGNEHVWHLYVARCSRRDDVLAALGAAGIGTGVHYPAPVHLLPLVADLGHRPGDFPVAEADAARIVSLPMFPGITVAQQERVAAALRGLR